MTKEKKEVYVPNEPPFGGMLIWGSRKEGKTLMSLNSPWQPVHIIDLEDSAKDYESQSKRMIEAGYLRGEFTRAACYTWGEFKKEWERIVGHQIVANSRREETYPKIKDAEDTHYGTIIIDTAGQWTEWVKSEVFGRATVDEANKMSQVVWGRVRDALRNQYLGLAKHCDMLIVTAHMSSYNNIDSPRCNPTILELVSLGVQVKRQPNQLIPNGKIDIARLPFFPPRVKEVTIEKLVNYVDNPADYDNLSEDEMVMEEPKYVPSEGEYE